MTRSKILGATLSTALAIVLASSTAPAWAHEAAPQPVPVAAAKPAFVPAAFIVPTRVETPGFTLVPLGPDLAQRDFDAYMASIPHLQQTFSRSTSWPREGITAAEALADMEAEQARFTARSSFAYAVLTSDGSRERGCVYVYPSKVPGHDAVVRLWVTKAEYDAGFDAELQAWVTTWMRTAWPLRRVAYPGRTIAWAEWDRLVAANAPPAAHP